MKKLSKVLVLLLVLLLSLSVIVACGETPTPDTPDTPDGPKPTPTPTPTDYVEIASVADLLAAAQLRPEDVDIVREVLDMPHCAASLTAAAAAFLYRDV